MLLNMYSDRFTQSNMTSIPAIKPPELSYTNKANSIYSWVNRYNFTEKHYKLYPFDNFHNYTLFNSNINQKQFYMVVLITTPTCHLIMNNLQVQIIF